MTTKAHKLGPGFLTLGAAGSTVEFGAQLTECALEPSVSEKDSIYTLDGGEVEGDTSESYNLTAKLFQQYDLDSLLVWAHIHRSEVVPFTFVPDDGRLVGATGSVRIRALKIGGTVRERNQSDLSWPGVGGLYELINAETKAPITSWAPLAEQPALPAEQPLAWA